MAAPGPRLGYASHWVKDLMDQADVQLTEPQRKALMEARGRSCAKSGAARRKGDVIKVTYPRCFCPLVAESKEPLSASYCFCSAGWLAG